MNLRPFGYRFEINTRLTVAQVREAIYERQRNRFNPASGASATVVDSLIFLWLPEFRVQPQLICLARQTADGSRLVGRAGYGILQAVAIAVIFVMFAITAAFQGHWASVIAAAFGAFLAPPLLGLGASKTADPLVRYLKNSFDDQDTASALFALPDQFAVDLRLEVGGMARIGPITPQMLFDAVRHLEEGGADTLFLIRAATGSIQATTSGACFNIEQRVDGDANYTRARRRSAAAEGDTGRPDRLSREEALTAFLAYAAGTALPEQLEWAPPAPRLA